MKPKVGYVYKVVAGITRRTFADFPLLDKEETVWALITKVHVK